MRKALLVFLAGVGGFAAAYAASAAAILTAYEVFGVVDRDGGGAMGVFFFWSPAIGFVCGVVAGILVARRY